MWIRNLYTHGDNLCTAIVINIYYLTDNEQNTLTIESILTAYSPVGDASIIRNFARNARTLDQRSESLYF